MASSWSFTQPNVVPSMASLSGMCVLRAYMRFSLLRHLFFFSWSSLYILFLGVSVKVIQLLQHFEHLAPVLVHALALWATEYGMKSLVGEIMR